MVRTTLPVAHSLESHMLGLENYLKNAWTMYWHHKEIVAQMVDDNDDITSDTLI
jgi:hypothetical protein